MNEPSVFMWSLGNEVAWQESELPLAEKLVSVAHAADPSRPVCINDSSYLSKGIDGIGNDIHERMDVRGYSYASEDHLVAIHAKHPNDLIVNSESGCSLGSRGYYVYPTDVPDGVRGTEFPFEPGRQPWNDDTYEITSYDITANRGTPITKDFMRSMKLDFHMGEFTWTGFDYIGEPAPYIGNFYWNDQSQTESDGTVLAPKTSYYGIVDSTGFPKDEWWLYRSLWTDPDDAPMVHLLPHWNWRQGEPVQVWAYSNAAKVELFLNGRSLGVREFEPHATGFHIDTAHPDKPFAYRFAKDDPRDSIYLHWDVAFEPGELKAVAYDATGREVARDVLRTAGSPAAVRLRPDRDILHAGETSANDRDMSFITADIVDDADVVCPDADNRLTFTVENGVILGTDNGYQASTEAFQSPVRKAYRGKALVIVASDGSGRPIIVRATAVGLRGGETGIAVGTAAGENSKAVTNNRSRNGDDADVRPRRPFAVVPHTTAVAAGVVPSLPDNATVVYDDGGKRSEPVVWRMPDRHDWSDTGRVTVRGDILTPEQGGDAGPSATAVIRVLGPDETPASTTMLDDLRLNGTTIGGFDPAKRRYTVTLPYDTGIPTFEPIAHDNAAAVVIPPVDPSNGRYLVEIASEDHSRGATIGIDVITRPAPIESVSVHLAGDGGLVEDQTAALVIEARDVLGRPIGTDILDVRIDIADPAILAVVDNGGGDADASTAVAGTLTGSTDLTVHAAYAGATVVSAPLPVSVGRIHREKRPIAVEPVHVRCEVGERPDLPNLVTVRFDRGLDPTLPVTWCADDDLWQTVGTRDITGTLAGPSGFDAAGVIATATVSVVDVIAVQRISTATVTGIVPDLAGTAPTVRVWWSDGLVEERDVNWRDASPKDCRRPGAFTILGDVDGIDAKAEATVRVTDEYTKNRDLFSFRNDVYPTVEASYTNHDPRMMEDVSNLMDGTVSYTARAGYNLKNRWSTFGDPDDTAWLEYRFGYGTETPFMLNAFTIYYCLEGEGVALPESVTISAWNGGDWVPVSGLKTHDKPVEQQGSAGWIYGSFGDTTKSEKIDRGLERTYTFDMVKTSRLRIGFVSGPGECVAITEIRGDAQVAVVNEGCALAGLAVDDVSVPNFAPDVEGYTVVRGGGDGADGDGADGKGEPVIEPKPAGDNAAITVVPPVDGGDTALVELTAENGVTKRTYTIRFR
ncbi:DUF4982 domain-containing protein [Bifidobacterium sp. 82T24]|uniref:DUF4982 domain-containing protein n=1 Tax=Bifidobacterium pluvialisilvae TaxID=2834436 RepID=UPI001C570BD8|nr:DUF4982 domain-containing protein [Bifidobacterium pluvialisilvae]MBW3087206.1 DUF4982 domain-containing protein [Bifidobacterium pluvialisilvae]